MARNMLITPTDTGPLHIRGSFTLVLPSGRGLETDSVALKHYLEAQPRPPAPGTPDTSRAITVQDNG